MHRRPERVLHVLPGASGGSARSTIDLIRGLRAAGIASAVASHDAGTPQERAELTDAVDGDAMFLPLYLWHRKIRTRAWKRPLIEARQSARTRFGRGSSAKIAAFAHAREVDLVHSATLLTVEGARVAHRLGVPHVWHVRELTDGPDAPFRFRVRGARLARHVGARAEVVVANSAASAVPFTDVLQGDRVRIVENAVDVERFATAARQPNPRPVVAMVGSLTSRWKEHLVFVAAMAELADLGIEARIYGHDPSDGGRRRGDAYTDAVLDAIAASGAPVRLMGFRDDPVAIMREIDVLVHPSRRESFGRVAVEAFAAGVPVVVPLRGGLATIVEDGVTGLLVPPGDVRCFAAATRRVLSDRGLRDRLVASGRTAAAERFSLEAHVGRIVEVYEAALARTHAPTVAGGSVR